MFVNVCRWCTSVFLLFCFSGVWLPFVCFCGERYLLQLALAWLENKSLTLIEHYNCKPYSHPRVFCPFHSPINPWQVSLRKVGDVMALSSEQFELHLLQIYIVSEWNNRLYTWNNRLYTCYGINTIWKFADHQVWEQNLWYY